MLRILSGLNALYRNYKSNPTESNIFAARVIHPILDDKTEKKVFEKYGDWSSLGCLFFDKIDKKIRMVGKN